MYKRQILNRAPVSPVRLNPKIPAELEKIVNRLLEKSPEQRYSNAEKLRTDLQQLKRDSGSGRIAAVTAAAVEKSVAVLYFENLSGAKDDEYFRDGDVYKRQVA